MQSKTIQVWAHRGASEDAPENTLEAFQLAVGQGADGVELDVQMSADGELVVAHDERLERVSNGTGFIKDKTLAELKTLDFSKSHFAYGISRIPTLRDVYHLLGPTEILFNVEIKSGIVFYQGIEHALLALEQETGMRGRILYSSFNHYSLLELRRLDPAVKIGLLYQDGWVNVPVYAQSLRANAVHPSKYGVRVPGLVHQCQCRGIAVNPWIVDTEKELLEMVSLQVNAVITNRPGFARQTLRKLML